MSAKLKEYDLTRDYKMTNPLTTLAASASAFVPLAGCETGRSTSSGLSTRISEPVCEIIYLNGVARIHGDECQNIRWSLIAPDRCIDEVVDGMIRRGNSPLEARRAIREVSEVRLQAVFDKFLTDNNADDIDAFCALGSAEISNHTVVGKMMAGG